MSEIVPGTVVKYRVAGGQVRTGIATETTASTVYITTRERWDLGDTRGLVGFPQHDVWIPEPEGRAR